jgi:hypothetical protein
MKKCVAAPARLVALPPQHELAKLGALVESVPQVPSAELPTVKWRVRSTLRRRVEWRRRALRVAVVGSLLFLAGGVVGAVVQPVLLSKLRAKLATSTEPQSQRANAIGAHGRRRGELPVEVQPPGEVGQPVQHATDAEAVPATTEVLTPVAPEARPAIVSVTPAPATIATGRKLPVPVPAIRAYAANTPNAGALRPPSPREAPAYGAIDTARGATGAYLLSPAPPAVPGIVPAPQHSAVALSLPAPAVAPQVSEQALLAKALRSLSIDRDPQRALAALDEHARHFGAGALAPEAARLRTWAFLLSGDRNAALAELSRQSSGPGFEGLPGGEEYLVLEGELHAKAGRWRESLADFELAVAACLAKERANSDGAALSRLERALWGRASARSHLGDRAGALADLREYLRRFPQGRFAVSAARSLKGGR